MILFLVIAFIITSQRIPENNKFYYAFNEKIYLEEVPDKYLIKSLTSEQSASVLAFVRDTLLSEYNANYQNENSFVIDLSKSTRKSIKEILKDKLSEIQLIKPVYKNDRQEMWYADEILVEMNDGVSLSDALSKLGLKDEVTVKQNKFYSVVQVNPTLDACEIANKIQESGMVKYSHPNFMMPIDLHQVTPNDTYFNNQFYLRNIGQVFNPAENHSGTINADINASFAWNATSGNNAIIVAVIDEGVTPNHPDLPNARQIRLNGSNFVPGENANDPTPGPNNNHGNACAGIIAATQNNNQGISGIAPNVRIMPIKIFGQNTQADNNGVVAAIDFAWQNGAHIISNSWGNNNQNPNFVPAIVNAINRAVTQGRGGLGSVVVFSASNSARRTVGMQGIVSFPSNVQINGVLTVGASDRNDRQADYSPISNVTSANNQIIDIVAPSHRAYPPQAYTDGVGGGIVGEGFEVWTMDIPGANGYNQWNDPNFPIVNPAFGEVLPADGVNNLSYTGRMGGTSAAAPQVAAVAALVLSLNNNLPQLQIFDILTQTAERVGGYAYDANGWSNELGFGRLNACAALGRIPGRFSIAGVADLCANNAQYTVNGLPAGSSVNWSSSNNSIAPISSTGNATRVGNGVVTFTATTIPNRCGGQSISRQVTVGAPSNISNLTLQMLSNDCYNPRDRYTVVGGNGATTYKWYYRRVSPPSSSFVLQQSGPNNYFDLTGGRPGRCDDVELKVEATNNCNPNAPVVFTKATLQCRCSREEAMGISVIPNPAASTVNVQISSASDESKGLMQIQEIRVFDKMGLLKKRIIGNRAKEMQLDVSDLSAGIYTISVFDGTAWGSVHLSKL
ncbi:MAG: S8 family serine peptidase [Agriterribacter sp.]